MKRDQKVLLLTLTVPLLLFSTGYAYAAVTSSTYVVLSDGVSVLPGDVQVATAFCNTNDYATGGGMIATAYDAFGPIAPVIVQGVDAGGAPSPNGGVPRGIQVYGDNPKTAVSDAVFKAEAVCQTPIAVAGVTVPEFGSLYTAIALAAVLYFGLSVLKARKTSPARSVPN